MAVIQAGNTLTHNLIYPSQMLKYISQNASLKGLSAELFENCRGSITFASGLRISVIYV
jgi:hypothetical protein